MSILLVVVNDLYVGRPRRAIMPFKADPPLIVDADTVLALAVPAQCLEPVPGQSGEIAERGSRLHAIKLEARGPLKTGKRLYSFPISKVSSPLVAVAEYHTTPQGYQRNTRYVKRNTRIVGPRTVRAPVAFSSRSAFNKWVTNSWYATASRVWLIS